MRLETDGIDVLESEVRRISEISRASDLTTPVDHLGRWKVRDVVAHLGGVHRWATRIVKSRSMDGPGSKKSKLDGGELLEWFDAGAEELVDSLRENNSDSACQNFNPGSENTIGWWVRRQTHETTVHRWDIEKALGLTTPIDPAVAADGVDEFLDVFVRTRGKQTLIGPLELRSSDPANSWTLRPAQKPGRVDINTEGAEPAVKLSGQPEELLLVLWGRLSLDETELAIVGDRSVADTLVPSG